MMLKKNLIRVTTDNKYQGPKLTFLCGRQVANKHFFFPVATANMMEKSGRQKVSIKFLLYSEARKHEDQFTAIWPISSSSHLVLF